MGADAEEAGHREERRQICKMASAKVTAKAS